MLEMLKNGSGIHIKKKNRGSFTKWCGGNVTDECIRRGKNSPNPKIRKKATFADNARHFKHKLGGILKGQNGLISPEINVDLTPANLKQLYDKYKAYGNGRYIDTLLLRNVDNELIKHNVGYPQRMAVLVTTQQEGNRTGSHGNGARGLVGWRSGRAANLPSTVEGQVKKLHNETYGEFNGNNWNDGGKGSGYMSGRDAQKAFKNAKTISEAVRAFNYGYVRPPASDTRYRINLSKKLFKKGGKAFVPGVSITDSNPKMYKYVKKHYKLKGQYGTKLNFFQKAGNFLNSDTGKTIVGTIGQLYSGIQNNINDSKLMNELQKWKESYINSAQPEDFSEQIMREEQQMKESNPDYNSSPIAIKFRENQLQQENLRLNKEKRTQEADQYITNFILSRQNNNQSKSNIGDLLTQGLGYIGNYLGKSNDTSSKLFNNTSGYSPISISSSTTTPSADSVL